MKKVYTHLDRGFIKLIRLKIRITKALHSLIRSKQYFQAHLRRILRNLGFQSSFNNNNLWVLKDNDRYLAYTSVFANDILLSTKNTLEVYSRIKEDIQPQS